jgi:hypothetical protein
MRAAQFFRIGMVHVQLWHLRSAAALHQAFSQSRAGRHGEARRFGKEARRCARRIPLRTLGFSRPLSELMLAGSALVAGDSERADHHLREAIARFTGEDMVLYAAAARMRLGELVGGEDGAALLAQGRAAFEAAGVVNVARFSNMLAPMAVQVRGLLTE